MKAAEECGAPIVSIAGGEPLIHPEIVEIVKGLVDQGRYVYLCTNALLLDRYIDLMPKSQAIDVFHPFGRVEGTSRSHLRGRRRVR